MRADGGDQGTKGASPACPVCGRTDALPVRHGLRPDRRSAVEDDGAWYSGRCLGPTSERWHCRGCGCDWPPPAYRFNVFVDVVAADHASAKAALEEYLYGSPEPDGVEIDVGHVGNAIGYLDEHAEASIWADDD